MKRYEQAMPACISRFYAVGFVLFVLPWTRNLFVALTVPSLLLALGAVLFFHRGWNRRQVLLMAGVVVSAFLLEVLGVQTGFPFGVYRYGRGLAPLLFGTPLIIGLNWLLVVYCSRAVASFFVAGPWLRVAASSTLMVAYDLAVEWAAPAMRMWQFESVAPPAANYAAWFAAGLVYQSLFEWCGVRADNPTARFLFVAQGVFFLLMGLFAQSVSL